MENCGGGQRLPPDGDEFPSSYQEFSNANNQQQYRFSSTSRNVTMTTNGSSGSVVDGNNTTCSENDNFSNKETYKILTTDNNSVVTSRSILLPDSRMIVSNVDVCQESVISSPDTRLGNDKSIFRTNEDSNKRSATVVTSYSSYCTQNGNNNLLVSEKKIEIAGYYHKEVPTIEKETLVDKEIPADTPPPLPITSPPKLEGVLQNRNVPTTVNEQTPTRKFSLNSELWRQDDKSERSVRDKIAMFSSQSSLDSPLFPNPMTATAAASNGRRLSKYKSSDDVCTDDKNISQKDKASFFADRTQSSFDLTDSVRSYGQNNGRKYSQRSPSLSKFDVSPVNSTSPTSPTSPTSHAKLTPPVSQKQTSTTTLTSSFDTKQNFSIGSSITNPYYSSNASLGNSQNGLLGSNVIKNYVSSVVGNDTPKSNTTTSLTRATSFCGTTPYTQDRTISNDVPTTGSQISRTNSLASTFRKPNEEARRNSLNQLIEQRRRSISKLRGLVIPEKDAVPIDRPIVDLPEIKSRDSILVHQMPKANIQDKWGSQSSLASNTSTASAPLKATTSFKMPAPQINSKYSPAFKRKSLAVYSSSTISTSSINGSKDNSSTIQSPTTTTTSTTLASEPPKSLESICSPTRSDYSFEFVSTASSPDASRTRPKTIQRKSRNDYDDSDNDSAVSSSQSSISRGFSPPMSPAPSERSTVSSERSYVSTDTNYQRRSLIVDTASVRNFVRESIDREPFANKSNLVGERTYLNSERSSSSNSNPRSPQLSESSNSRTSQIPQRQTHLRRSNSTDTNCSTSSTLTSGSQASAESLSRRVLKPQSVEAINRKNILASARCRSGRDLNGSPLIQRKFSDDEDLPTSTTQNGTDEKRVNTTDNGVSHKKDIKMAYIDVTDNFKDEKSCQKKIPEPKLPPKKSIPTPVVRPPKSEMLEPSNDLKMWVRAEAKALIKSTEEKSVNKYEKTSSLIEDIEFHTRHQSTSNGKATTTLKSEDISDRSDSKHRRTESESETDSSDTGKSRSRSSIISDRGSDDQNDLLTILTTRSRSRSAIHVDDGTFGRSKSQMSLEDILGGKADPKLLRVQNIENKSEKHTAFLQNKSVSESRDNRYTRKSNLEDSWNEERSFVSKIPTLGRSRGIDSGDETIDSNDRSKNNVTKIPTARSLGRRSASVTDMKKALEKMDATTNNRYQTPVTSHNRFPSLDSSVDENACGSEADTDRCCGEQFGSISSLASSTSLISQQELAQLVEEASLEEARGAHDIIVVLLHKENPTGSVGITLAGGADCEVKEITVHRVLVHSIADKDGRVQKGDRILSINGRSTRGLTHRESLAVLKQPRSEVVLVVSRARMEEGCKLRSRTASVETIVEGFEISGSAEDTAWGPPSTVAIYKGVAGLGFSLEGGRDSPLGDRPLVIKKIFTGGAAEKTGALRAGDQLLEVNGSDVTRMSRIEAWSLMKKLHDGEVNLLVRHPATKSS